MIFNKFLTIFNELCQTVDSKNFHEVFNNLESILNLF